MNPDEKVVVGYLDNGATKGPFAHDLFLMGASRSNRFAGIVNESDNLIARGRNRMVKSFLESGPAEWLLMLDADQRFSLEAFDMLVAAADAEDRPIISGLYFAVNDTGELYPLPMPVIYMRNAEHSFHVITHYPENTVIQIDGAGAGFMLVHRSVFEKIAKNAGPEYLDRCWFRDYPLRDGDGWFGEDLYFCNKANEAGFSMFCHTGAVSPHIKSYAVTEAHFLKFRDFFDSQGIKSEFQKRLDGESD